MIAFLLTWAGLMVIGLVIGIALVREITHYIDRM